MTSVFGLRSSPRAKVVMRFQLRESLLTALLGARVERARLNDEAW